MKYILDEDELIYYLKCVYEVNAGQNFNSAKMEEEVKKTLKLFETIETIE